MSGHTPGPWSIFDQHDATRINIRGPNEEFVADCADGFYSDETDDWVMADESLPNAAFIVRACNNHDALLEALKQAVEWDGCDSEGVDAVWLEQARAAIAAATGAGS